jgi:hypothetical protein
MVALVAVAPGARAQRTFATAEEAAQALLEAGKTDDLKALEAIFGPGSEVVLSSGDPVDDANERKWFVTKASEKMTIEHEDDEWAVVTVGENAWPFAIPLHRQDGAWAFDLEEGEQELLDRRIGNNELVTISVMRAYVDAQREYAAEDPDNDGVGNYARRILSTEGRRDGLYYPTDEDEEASPLGELVAEASAQGYQTTSGGGEPAPYEGYRYKVLTEQGSHAPGGAMSYEEDGKLTKGFALLAWPATYGVSGIKTFVVNQLGIVFEKNLGPETGTVASAIAAYDPDRTWSPSAD